MKKDKRTKAYELIKPFGNIKPGTIFKRTYQFESSKLGFSYRAIDIKSSIMIDEAFLIINKEWFRPRPDLDAMEEIIENITDKKVSKNRNTSSILSQDEVDALLSGCSINEYED